VLLLRVAQQLTTCQGAAPFPPLLSARRVQMGGQGMDRPLQLSWAKCRPDGKPGPCQPQKQRGELSIGGVIYGNFQVR